jgi:CRP/FNR family transcriptional regulator
MGTRGEALSADAAAAARAAGEALSCVGCPHLGVCMPAQAACKAGRPVRLASRRLLLQRREPLLTLGDRFAAIYGVRRGLLKGVLAPDAAGGLVTGFFFPGDVAGLDGIALDRHPTAVMAVTDAEVCVVPFERLEAWAARAPAVQRHLHRLLSREIARGRLALLPLARLTAVQRVADFLLRFAAAQSHGSGSPSDFLLALTLEEMGSHLGLKMETVSRVLSQLVSQRLIARDGRSLRILEVGDLDRLARAQRAGPEASAIVDAPAPAAAR